jgi:hypothetical protein
MYIVWGNNIFRARDAHPVHAAHRTSITGTHIRCRNGIDGNQCAKTKWQLERNFTISRTKEYHKKKRVLVSEARASRAIESITRRESTMTNFKLISAAAILSAAIATPAFAQEAAQEPGLQAFYQSLGVGFRSSATASAMASARSGSNASVPVKRISAKHYTSDHKM